MIVSVVGTGYVGLITGVGFSQLDHSVTCIDVDEKKVKKVNSGKPPIFENGLEEALKDALSRGMRTETGYASVKEADVVFVCVGTPSRKDGSVDLQFIEAVGHEIGRQLKHATKFVVVVVKSTVVPGTALSVGAIIEKESGKKAGVDFGIAMTPEFLKEGTAIEDFRNPDRIVVGSQDERSRKILEQLNSSFKCPFLYTDTKTAEMVKYASNAFLATKISFINEIANLCEKEGIDVYEVAKGVGLDKRISPHFLAAGAGFGGSCFPKDVKAIMAHAKAKGGKTQVLDAVMKLNAKQPLRVLELAIGVTALEGKKVAVLGLAFKPDTDDVRESPAIVIVKGLKKLKCAITVYDPKGMHNFRKVVRGIKYANSFEECLQGAEVCLIVTDWKEFKRPASDYRRLMSGNVVIDGRRTLNAKEAKDAGLIYRCIGASI